MRSAVVGLPEQKKHAHPVTFYVDPEQVMQVLSSQSEDGMERSDAAAAPGRTCQEADMG